VFLAGRTLQRLPDVALVFSHATERRMTADTPHNDDGPPTEEIYIELRELEAVAADKVGASTDSEPLPSLAEDDPTGIKARIARLRAILSDRGIEPPR